MWRKVRPLLVLLPLTFSSAALGEVNVTLLLDTDGDSSTGCTIEEQEGFEHSLSTTVGAAEWQHTPCGSSMAIPAGATRGAIDATHFVSESGIPLASIGLDPMPPHVRIVVLVARGTLTLVLSEHDGSAIQLPDRPARRRATHPAFGSAIAITVDGETSDWSGIEPSASLAEGDSNVTLHLYRNTSQIYLLLQGNMPSLLARDDRFTVLFGRTLIVDPPGVLANDDAPDGEKLSADLLRLPDTGSVDLREDGGFTYRHRGRTAADDSFGYRSMTGGASSSETAVVLNVVPNGVPSAADDQYSVRYHGTLDIAAPGVLANDSDPNGDALDAALVTAPQHGTVVLNASGSFSYTHTASSIADDTFTYRADDGFDDSIGTVTIDILNSPPTAQPDAFSLLRGETLTVGAPGLLSNDSDIDGNPLTAELVSQPAHGTVTVEATGGFVYQHDASMTESDSFTYRVSDGIFSSEAVVVTLTIGANTPPVTSDDAITVAEGHGLSLPEQIFANDFDAETPSGFWILEIVTPPAHGAITGDLDYVHDGSETTADSFTYRVNDGAFSSNISTVVLTIEPVDDPPIAIFDEVTTDEDVAITIDVLANDIDRDTPRAGLVVTMVNPPFAGSATVQADGSVLYVPLENHYGFDVFEYEVSDGTTTNTTGVVIEVLPVPDPPVAVDDAITISEGATRNLFLLNNDSDGDFEPIVISEITAPAHGTLTNDGDFVRYVHDGTETAEDSFTYRISDGTATSDLATVRLTILPVNDAPVAADDVYSVDEGGTLDVPAPGVLANDADADTPLNPILLEPTHLGTLTLNGDGSFRYVHDGRFEQPTSDEFFYVIDDGSSPAFAMVTIEIRLLNDPPVASNDFAFLEEGSQVEVNVLNNDRDPERVVLAVGSFTQGAHGSVTLSGNRLLYQHDGSEAMNDSFTYEASDGVNGSAATVQIVIFPVDDPPSLEAPSVVTSDEDVPAVVSVAGGNAIRIIDPDIPPHVTMTLTGPPMTLASTAGLALLIGDGTDDTGMEFRGFMDSINAALDGLTIAPPGPDFAGTANLNIRIRDDAGSALDDRTVVVSFLPINDPPVNQVPGDALLTEDTATVIDGPFVLDIEAGTTQPMQVMLQAVHGTMSLATVESLTFTTGDGIDDGTMTFTGTADVIQSATAALLFRPEPDFFGTASITITSNDLGASGPPGPLSDTDIYSLVVQAVDDPPIALDDVYELNEAATLNVAAPGFLGNDSDDGGIVVFTTLTSPAHGTTSLTGGDGSFSYTHDGSEESSDSFQYTVTDGTFVATANVVLTIRPVDDPPSATDDSFSTDEDTSVTFDPRVNDIDVDGGAMTIEPVLTPLHGTATIVAGGIEYIPSPNFCGSDSFDYTLNGGSTATVTVTVGCVDDPPVAVADSFTVTEDGGAVTLEIFGNDTDVEGDPFVVIGTTDGTFGSVVVAPGGSSLTYQPFDNYCNSPPGTTPDTFTYTLGGGSTAMVTVTVNCVDDDPVAVNDEVTAVEDQTTFLDLVANDLDVDGDVPAVGGISMPPSSGEAIISANARGVDYTPAANFCGFDFLMYTLADGGSSASVEITVTCVDDPPFAIDDGVEVLEDSGANVVDVLANDSDIDDGPKTLHSVSDPAFGTALIVDPATLTYQPDPNVCGIQDSFTYAIQPGGATATVLVSIQCVDDPPLAVDDAPAVEEDRPSSIDVLANDTDIDGGANLVIAVTDGAHGAVVIDLGSGSVTYTPHLNHCSGVADTFTYTITGGSTATVTVTVSCIDDPPQAVADTFAVAEDSAPVDFEVLANDDDVDGGPIAVNSVTQPPNGTVTFTAANVTYQPDGDYCGADLFRYTLTPGGSETTVTVNVTCGGDGPVVSDSTFSVQENRPNGTNVGALVVSDPDPGETFTYSITGGSAAGVFDVDSSGNIVVIDQAALDFEATTSFTLQVLVTDSALLTDSGTITLNVTNVNEAPNSGHGEVFTAIGNTWLEVSVPANGQAAKKITGSLLANETDPDTGDTLQIVAVSAGTAQGGSITINADGSFRYIPATGFTGTDTFVYTVRDQGNLTATAMLTLEVQGMVWYVDKSRTGPFTGRADAPLWDASDTVTPSAPGHTIFLYGQPFQYSSLQLEDDQSLIGQGADLVVDGFTLVIAGSVPAIGTVTLADDVTVRGVNFVDSGGMTGDGVTGTITVSDIVSTQPAAVLQLLNSNATVTLSDCTLNGTSTSARALVVGGGSPDITVSCTIDMQSSAPGGIVINGTTGGSIVFNGPSLRLRNGGIAITDAAGDVTIDPSSGRIDVVVGSGDALGITGNSDGTFSFSDGSFGTTAGSSPRALRIAGVGQMGGEVTFRDVDFSAAGAEVVDISGLSSGSISFDAASSVSGSFGTAHPVTIGSNANSMIDFGGPVRIGSIGAPSIRGIQIGTNPNTSVIFNDVESYTSGLDALTLDTSNVTVRDGTLSSAGGSALFVSGGMVDLTLAGVSGILSFLNTVGTAEIAGGSLNGTLTTSGFSVNGGTVNVTYGGTIGGTCTERTLLVQNHGSGTLNFNGSISCGISLFNAAGTYNFAGTTAPVSSAQYDITIQNSSGTFEFGDQTTSDSLLISGGTPNVTFDGSLSNPGSTNWLNISSLAPGASVHIAANLNGGAGPVVNNNNGASITFSGTSKVFTGRVQVQNNPGSTIAFTNGGLSATASGAVSAFDARNGGTIVISGPGNQLAAANNALYIVDVDFDIRNTAMQSSGASAVLIEAGAGTLQNNSIGPAAADGIEVFINVGRSGTVVIDGNSIANYGRDGISLRTSIDGSTLQATVTGNSTTSPGDNGLFVFAGDNTTMCAHVSGNDFSAGGGGAADIDLLQEGTSVLRLPGYTGGATDTAALSAFIAAQNGGTETVTVSIGASGFTGGSACTIP